ncbi:hypothetical protein V8E53_013849 [Lactarius tabidus]
MICRGYLSDLSSEGEDIDYTGDEDNSTSDLDAASEHINHPSSTHTLSPSLHQNIIPSPLPKCKQRKLDISARTAREQAKYIHLQELKAAFVDIEKLIASKKTQFRAGANGLQSKRARSIQNCLHMVVNNQRHLIEASERAAESQGFAAKWGGRMVRQWVRIWIKHWDLPESERGCHTKVFSLLDDPEIQTELCSYLRTNKWSQSPQKLSDFTKNKLLPAEARKYLHNIVQREMPAGLKKYLELELFPHIEIKLNLPPGVLKLVLLAHDEMTAQSNNDAKMSWVLDGEQPLKKKGIGRGLHQSDVICSTKGWLPEASQTLEYSKNYDGYWNGKLFVKQLVERIIPAFEQAHGLAYQALIMVDNSQGHSAYSLDALLTSRMNMKPGGKQVKMRDGWYIMQNGMRVTQKMCFAPEHSELPGSLPSLPKGMRQQYLCEHCNYTFEGLKENMPTALASVSVATIRKWEHRMRRWMEAYRGGLDVKQAQFQVKSYSSRCYTSHRRVPEQVAAHFDT